MGKLTHIFIKDNIAPFMKQSGYKKNAICLQKKQINLNFL